MSTHTSLLPPAIALFVAAGSPTLAQWSTDSLSQPRERLAATATSSKLLFAGGNPPGVGNSLVVDIYDASTCAWSTSALSFARINMAATSVGDLALFGGGEVATAGRRRVDIYDAAANTWSIADLSEGRTELAATSVGGKALFAGGQSGLGLFEPSSRVDIFDSATGTWSTDELSEERFLLAATSVGDLALFAGGYVTASSSTVDIYDSSTDTWATAELSDRRHELVGATAGDKALFAGGQNDFGNITTRVDIYDASTGVWSTAELSAPRIRLAAASVGDLALFAGGFVLGANVPTDVVDVYDSTTDTWSVATLSAARMWLAGASIGNTAMFGGGRAAGVYYDTVDVFSAPIGEVFCTGQPNSTGLPARIAAGGLIFAACNDLTLIATDLPVGEFGYFLGGMTQAAPPVMPPGSSGLICLSGNIGRFAAPSQTIQGPQGTLQVDLTSIPVNPHQAAQAGETWSFQCWYRDQGNTNNFSEAIGVTFL